MATVFQMEKIQIWIMMESLTIRHKVQMSDWLRRKWKEDLNVSILVMTIDTKLLIP